MEDRDRTVSRRSKPSSRTTLIGEQPNPWNPFQLQDVMSRHRGAKLFRRYGLSKIISLLSPAYLLFVEWWSFHTESPDHYGRLKSLLDMLIFQLSRYTPLRCYVIKYWTLPLHTSGTFWEVTAPVKLPIISCFKKWSILINKEWYLTDVNTPTYSAQ